MRPNGMVGERIGCVVCELVVEVKRIEGSIGVRLPRHVFFSNTG